MSSDEKKRGAIPEREPTLKGEYTAALVEMAIFSRHDKFATLTVVSGPDLGRTLRLPGSIDVGRDPAAGLALQDTHVSWRHVRFEDRGAGEWAVVDLKSTNGMVVNETKRLEAILKPGDRVLLGHTILEYQERDALHEGVDAALDRRLNEDDLSGLWVKRRFDEELRGTAASVHAGEVPVASVVVMDLDGVKGINDTHGHSFGAFTIGESGKLIGRLLGARGYGTRFGGDEYAIVLPGASKRDAVAFAESVVRAVNEHVYENAGVRLHPGISCGVATMPDDALEPEAIFKAADEAMYRAKRGGKNRVAI